MIGNQVLRKFFLLFLVLETTCSCPNHRHGFREEGFGVATISAHLRQMDHSEKSRERPPTLAELHCSRFPVNTWLQLLRITPARVDRKRNGADRIFMDPLHHDAAVKPRPCMLHSTGKRSSDWGRRRRR